MNKTANGLTDKRYTFVVDFKLTFQKFQNTDQRTGKRAGAGVKLAQNCTGHQTTSPTPNNQYEALSGKTNLKSFNDSTNIKVNSLKYIQRIIFF